MWKQDPALFRRSYGDYYLAALELGADAGCSLLAATSSEDHETSFKVTGTIHALFWDASVEYSESHADSTSAFDLTFSSYNTHAQRCEAEHCAEGQSYAVIRQRAAQRMEELTHLRQSMSSSMREHGLRDGERLSLQQVRQLCTAGLVVRIILLPYRHLPSIAQLRYQSS